jgi:hypothetical protein
MILGRQNHQVLEFFPIDWDRGKLSYGYDHSDWPQAARLQSAGRNPLPAPVARGRVTPGWRISTVTSRSKLSAAMLSTNRAPMRRQLAEAAALPPVQ